VLLVSICPGCMPAPDRQLQALPAAPCYLLLLGAMLSILWLGQGQLS
jgi:hypothetical protein